MRLNISTFAVKTDNFWTNSIHLMLYGTKYKTKFHKTSNWSTCSCANSHIFWRRQLPEVNTLIKTKICEYFFSFSNFTPIRPTWSGQGSVPSPSCCFENNVSENCVIAYEHSNQHCDTTYNNHLHVLSGIADYMEYHPGWKVTIVPLFSKTLRGILNNNFVATDGVQWCLARDGKTAGLTLDDLNQEYDDFIKLQFRKNGDTTGVIITLATSSNNRRNSVMFTMATENQVR